MVDVVIRLFALIPREEDISYTQYKSRDGYKVYIDVCERLKDNGGKDNRRYTSGCTERVIARVVPVLHVGRYIGDDDAEDIQSNKIQGACRFEDNTKDVFNGGAKEV